jgi:hypothetical protein
MNGQDITATTALPTTVLNLEPADCFVNLSALQGIVIAPLSRIELTCHISVAHAFSPMNPPFFPAYLQTEPLDGTASATTW